MLEHPPFFFIYVRLIFNFFKISGKIRNTWGKSAGVRAMSISVFSSFAASQRLHAEDLSYAYLVGLFEGDGYFTITKNGQYLTYELGIELSIRDVQFIYKMKVC
jgi:hypothetical protein